MTSPKKARLYYKAIQLQLYCNVQQCQRYFLVHVTWKERDRGAIGCTRSYIHHIREQSAITQVKTDNAGTDSLN